MPQVTVIVPAYNEAANLPALHERLANVAAGIKGYEFEFLFVDDGSTDGTPVVLSRLRMLDARVRALRFSRNFGSHAACLAGLMNAQGDLAVILAADLQDPPEMLQEMLARMEEGFDVVLAVRSQREDPWVTVKLANLYHRLMRRYAIPTWPLHGADVIMIRRPVRNVVVQWHQKNTSIFAQILWSGFRQTSIFYDKQRRHAGRSKWTLRKKIKLLVDSFVSFSFSPVRLISYSGMGLSVVGFAYAVFIVLNKLFFSQPIPGWSSLMIVLLLVSGFQLLMLGVIGEYLWRALDEVRGTPPFVVQSRLGFEVQEQEVEESWESSSPGHTSRSLAEAKTR